MSDIPPGTVPMVPWSIMLWIVAAGQGERTSEGEVAEPELHFAEPMYDCSKPGFSTLRDVTGARTQPLLSCSIMARMKRASTSEDCETEEMADLIEAISARVSLSRTFFETKDPGTLNFPRECKT